MSSNKAKKTSSSKSDTSQVEHSTATTQQNVPDWLLDPAKSYASSVQGIMGQGPGAFTPQISDLQKQAFAGAGKLTTSPYFDQAGSAINGVGDVSADNIHGESLLDNLSAYETPYKQSVLNPVLDDYDYQSGQTRAAQAAAAARGNAFGGSRYGVQEAQTEGNLARGRASAEGQLLDQMFNTSTGLSMADADRRQSAAGANQSANLQAALANQSAGLQKASLLQGLGAAQGSEERANLGVQAGLGGVQTDAENAQRQYPLQFASQTGGLLNKLNPADYSGRTVTSDGTTSGTTNSSGTETSSQGLLSDLGQVAKIASLFMPVPH
jgi:hypothetical protein